jgi:hypothetical protein
MTLKILGAAIAACAIAALLALLLWRAYLRRHDEQILATRVARALHELGGSATASAIRRRVYHDGGRLEHLSDIRWNLRLMEIEGTVRVTLGARLALDGAVIDAPVYTFTPRSEVGAVKDGDEVRRGSGRATPSGGGGVEQGAYPLAVSTDCSGGEC